jgi:hypothetical protein
MTGLYEQTLFYLAHALFRTFIILPPSPISPPSLSSLSLLPLSPHSLASLSLSSIPLSLLHSSLSLSLTHIHMNRCSCGVLDENGLGLGPQLMKRIQAEPKSLFLSDNNSTLGYLPVLDIIKLP